MCVGPCVPHLPSIYYPRWIHAELYRWYGSSWRQPLEPRATGKR